MRPDYLTHLSRWECPTCGHGLDRYVGHCGEGESHIAKRTQAAARQRLADLHHCALDQLDAILEPRAATPICRDIDGIQGEHDWQPAVDAHARCARCGMTRTLDTRADGGQRTAYRDAGGYLVNEQVMSVPMATAPRRWQSPIPQDAPPDVLVDLLRSLIKSAGITQGAAARLLGVAPRTVRGWLEAGERRRQVPWSSVELLRRLLI